MPPVWTDRGFPGHLKDQAVTLEGYYLVARITLPVSKAGNT